MKLGTCPVTFACKRKRFPLHNVRKARALEIKLSHIKIHVIVSGFHQLLSIQYAGVHTKKCSGKNFSRYLWSALKVWSRSKCLVNSDTPRDAIFTFCMHNLQQKQCLFLRGSSGPVANRAANGNSASISSLKNHHIFLCY